MTGTRVEAAVLAAALLALVLLASLVAREIKPIDPPCSGEGHELAGTCHGENPGHI